MTLSLTLDTQAGASIATTSAELQATADRLALVCELSFNGVKLVAYPGGDAGTLRREYGRAIKDEDGPQLAFSTRELRR